MERTVEQILEHKFPEEGEPMFLVQWADCPPEDATWVSQDKLYDDRVYQNYRRHASREDRRKMTLPLDLRLGTDEDGGLCVRHAVEKLQIPDVNPEAFKPWMTINEMVTELRDQGCSVSKVRRRMATKGKKLMLIRGRKAFAVDCRAKGYRKVYERNHIPRKNKNVTRMRIGMKETKF